MKRVLGSCPVLVSMSLFVMSCGDDEQTSGREPTQLFFDLDGAFTSSDTFFDHPFPSDLRLDDDGTPSFEGFPNRQSVPLVEGLLSIADTRAGFAVSSVSHFRFSRELAPIEMEASLSTDAMGTFFLIDIDPASDDRGTVIPAWGTTPPEDIYTASGMLTIAPRPGVLLFPNRMYAAVVTDALMDAEGEPVAQAADLAAVLQGETPSGAMGADANELYAPLRDALDSIDFDKNRVVAANVFTTGDVVADTHDLSQQVLEAYDLTIDGLAFAEDHGTYCELNATIDYPQFQRGEPPFDTEGLFDIGSDGLPIEQRIEQAPVVILLPKTDMPADGYPTVAYWHGSGGESDSAMHPKLTDEKHLETGPAPVLAAQGIALGATALPVNPERLPGAEETEYLNFNNLAAMRDTFRQGVIEQRLFIEAMLKLEIPPAMLSACDPGALPAGETAYRFDGSTLMGMGQSMGGMYTNMIGAVEPLIRAAVPTGAGGYWTYFIMETQLIANIPGLLGVLLSTQAELSFMHPVLSMAQQALETVDPFVYMPRLARYPLPDHPVRPIYEPVGLDDSYFPTTIYDAAALAYGHPQAGDTIWPEMQEALAIASLDGFVDYPIQNNLTSLDGSSYTGIVVQYEGTPGFDPHSIYATRDEVKHQYGCFLKTFADSGEPTVPAPAALGSPCD